MTSVHITVPSGDEPHLDELFDWLRDDAALRRGTQISGQAPRGSGSMGALEVIDVVATHVEQLGALAIAFATWWKTRAENPKSVTFTRGDKSLTITNPDPETMENLRRLFDEPQPGDDD